MGVIDETSVRLRCEKCGATDTIRATQKGSVYSPGAWSDFSASKTFDVVSKRGSDGPEVTSAACKNCKAPALVG